MKTLIIDGNELLNWLSEHEQVWEDMLNYFKSKEEDYTRIMVTSSQYYPIEEE